MQARLRPAVLPALLLAALLAPSAAPARTVEGEELLFAPPAGWSVAARQSTPQLRVAVMLPAGQTLSAWTEMIAVQIHPGLRDDPAAFVGRIQAEFARRCATAVSHPPLVERVKDYPTAVALLECRGRADAPEAEAATMVKAVQGRDHLFVVQRSWQGRAEGPGNPARDEAAGAAWRGFMQSVEVCDGRRPELGCAGAALR
ncbi:MAG TPA: hypothetical protein VEH84_17640 [Alphaproteobacteria bacterium]|nr:hypothetical protein [Alphaproteobacteria bacterium]